MARIARRIAGIGASDLPDAAAFDAYVGPAREITVDQQRGIIALHDGVTPGGQQFHAGGGGGGDTAIDPIPKSFAGIAGTNQTYTLDLVPATAGNVLVYVGGIRQTPITDYTVSGVTLTILDNPDGLEVDTLLLAGPYSLTTVPNNSVTTNKLVDEAVTLPKVAPEILDRANHFGENIPDNGSVTRSSLTTGLRKLFQHRVSPFEFGAVGDLVADDGPAVQAAIDFLFSIGGGTLDLTGNFKIVDGVALTGVSNIAITSDYGRVYYPQTSANYYHLFRVNNCSSVLIEKLDIYSDVELERGDTGFAIQVSATFGIRITGCHFTNIASACIWVDNSQDVIATNNIIDSGKADGIHFADGCIYCICSDNIINSVEDDAIAVVRDVGGGIPNSITISGNVVRQITRGHGVVLISCDNVAVTGNDLSGFIGAAIGSYTWTGTTDRATNLFISGNKIRDTANAPENAASACSILLMSTSKVVISGNDIEGPETVDATYSNPAVFFIDNSVDVSIKENAIHDSAKYGVYVNDVAGTVNEDIRVLNNYFKNIVNSAVRIRPATQTGEITVSGNTYEDVAYNNPDSRVIDIANAGANRVYIGGNKQTNQSRTYYVNLANCLNVFAEDNTPAVKISYDPNERATGDVAFTNSTGTGSYWRSNGMIFVKIIAAITTKGAGFGLFVDLPFASDGGGHAFQYREMASVGSVGTAEFSDNNTLYLSPADAASGNPVADGRTIEINGWYTG